MGTPLLGQFLVAINGFIQVRNAGQLADYLVLEPPFGDHYMRMVQELKQTYPKGSEDALERKCNQGLGAAREGAEGSPWTAFIKFMVQYLGYLRDVDADPNKYLETYNLLSELQQRANSALSHGPLGYLMLPIVITNARLVCRLAIGLDKQPELIAHSRSGQQGWRGRWSSGDATGACSQHSSLCFHHLSQRPLFWTERWQARGQKARDLHHRQPMSEDPVSVSKDTKRHADFREHL